MKKRLFSLLIGSLLSGPQIQAIVYAVDKLTKGDRAVYLFSDVPGQSDAAARQKEIFLAQANSLNAKIFADDRHDYEDLEIMVSSDNDKHTCRKAQQIILDTLPESANEFSALSISARQQGAQIKNMCFSQLFLYDSFSCTSVKDIIDAFKERISNERLSKSSVQQRYDALFATDIPAGSTIGSLSKNQKQLLNDLSSILLRNDIIDAVEHDKNSNIFVYSLPTNMATVYSVLKNEGWESETTNILTFHTSWAAYLQAGDSTQEAANKSANAIDLAGYFGISNSGASSSHAASSSEVQEPTSAAESIAATEVPVANASEHAASIPEEQPTFTRTDAAVCAVGIASVAYLACVAYTNNFDSWLCNKAGLLLANLSVIARSRSLYRTGNWLWQLGNRLSR